VNQPVSKAEWDEKNAARLAGASRWVQEYIADLERRAAELEARVAALSEGPAKSDTAVDGLGVYPDRELGRHVLVTFRLPDGSLIRTHTADEYLELNALGSGLSGDCIITQPSSGNVLRVRTDRYW
jgi:hypothetical protein